MSILNKNRLIFIILFVFFLINLTFLTNFPFVHSDEVWLSGLTRTIMTEGNFAVTEPFFDLYPRHPHAIRTIFNLLQMPLIRILGYRVISVRLLSLLCGTGALFFFYKLSQFLTGSPVLSLAGTILLGMDVQFIYASHFARQEIILVLIMLAALYYFLAHYKFKQNKKQDLILGLLLVIAIGIHPNSFVISLPFICIYGYHVIITGKIKLTNLLALISMLVAGALVFILLSLSFDHNFFANYTGYGQTLGVLSPFPVKLERFIGFYKKIYYTVSGTYYTPDIKIQFYVFSFTLLISIFNTFFRPGKYRELLLTLLALNTGYIVIGRYNQTGIIFLFPVFYLLLITCLQDIVHNQNTKYILATALIILIAINTGLNINNDINFDYQPYISEISRTVDRDNTVLANLNTGFYFDPGHLYDYRNLAYLEKNNLTFAGYIEKNGIEYIIYPQELDFIYNTRPVWNIMYGNLTPFYQDMKQFLATECRPVHSFDNPSYPMRIVRYMGKQNWEITIYKVISRSKSKGQ